MKRFIDLRFQGTSNRFAFWDMVVGRFDTYDGEMAWKDWAEFEDQFRREADAAGGLGWNDEHVEGQLKRHRGLCPPWVFEPATDAEVGFCDEPDDYTDIVFDSPPAHESGRFIEVEDAKGAGVSLGEWVERPDGYWALRLRHDRLVDYVGRRPVFREEAIGACHQTGFATASGLNTIAVADKAGKESWEWSTPSELAERLGEIGLKEARVGLAASLALYGANLTLYGPFGLLDKQGKPLIAHVLRVAAAPGLSEDQEIAAILHDCLEDCPEFVTEPLIEHLFGSAVLRLVVAVTRLDGESYADYIERLAETPNAIPIKLADLRDNLDESRGPIPASLRLRYEQALRHLEGLYEGEQATGPAADYAVDESTSLDDDDVIAASEYVERHPEMLDDVGPIASGDDTRDDKQRRRDLQAEIVDRLDAMGLCVVTVSDTSDGGSLEVVLTWEQAERALSILHACPTVGVAIGRGLAVAADSVQPTDDIGNDGRSDGPNELPSADPNDSDDTK